MTALPVGTRYTDAQIAASSVQQLKAVSRGATGSPATRRLILNSGPCVYCGDPNPTVIDHIIPVSQMGTGALENLAPACKPCNDNKLDFTPEEWKAWRISEGMCWPPKTRFEQIRETFLELLAADGLTPEEFHRQRQERRSA